MLIAVVAVTVCLQFCEVFPLLKCYLHFDEKNCIQSRFHSLNIPNIIYVTSQVCMFRCSALVLPYIPVIYYQRFHPRTLKKVYSQKVYTKKKIKGEKKYRKKRIYSFGALFTITIRGQKQASKHTHMQTLVVKSSSMCALCTE